MAKYSDFTNYKLLVHLTNRLVDQRQFDQGADKLDLVILALDLSASFSKFKVYRGYQDSKGFTINTFVASFDSLETAMQRLDFEVSH